MLCDDPEGWDEGGMGGRLNTEGIHTHTHTHTHKLSEVETGNLPEKNSE